MGALGAKGRGIKSSGLTLQNFIMGEVKTNRKRERKMERER